MYHSSALLINTEKCFCRYLPSGICCLFYLCANNINSSFHTFLFILFLSISQFSSVAQSCPTLCDLMDCNRPGFPVRHQLLEPAQTHVHQVGDAIQPSPTVSSPSPTFNLSQHQGLFKDSVLRLKWPKYWSFSFSICPSNEYSGLISFRMDWLDLLAVQGTLQSLLQHHSSKASLLCAQLSLWSNSNIHT